MKQSQLPTPCYVIDEVKLEDNLRILKEVADASGCKILLAQKCFSMFSLYPLIGRYLHGTTASGLHEAKLSQEYMKKENHVYAAAYRDDEMQEIFQLCDHVVFNSFSQWKRHQALAKEYEVSCGLRINPQLSTQEGHAQYDPCAPFSRMGIPIKQFEGQSLEGIEGLHFHTLCEQNADALVATLEVIERDFQPYLHKLKWLNFGGGHHITRADYDRQLLIDTIKRIKATYDVEVYVEPGEAIALDAGILITTVLDVLQNGMNIAILDTSATCHMPDVLEMPYLPRITQASKTDAPHTYRLGGPTCLAGDIIGDYSFDEPLVIGQRLSFEDMAIYTMVKNNTFNGINLPTIAVARGNECEVIKSFGYEEFKQRLS